MYGYSKIPQWLGNRKKRDEGGVKLEVNQGVLDRREVTTREKEEPCQAMVRAFGCNRRHRVLHLPTLFSGLKPGPTNSSLGRSILRQ
jgi:hypothetical protein